MCSRKRGGYRGDEGRGKARRGAPGRVEHVPGEGDDVGGAHDRQERGGGGQHAREQVKLASHAGHAAGVPPRLLPRGPVALPRERGVPAQQRGLRRGQQVPARQRRTARSERGLGLAGKRTCPLGVAEQHGQRRSVDARIRVARERVGGEVLVARACREDVGVAPGRRAVQRVLPQPPAQREDLAADRAHRRPARGWRGREARAPPTPRRRARARARRGRATPRRRSTRRPPRGMRRTPPTAHRGRGMRARARVREKWIGRCHPVGQRRASSRPPAFPGAASAAPPSPPRCARARSRRRRALHLRRQLVQQRAGLGELPAGSPTRRRMRHQAPPRARGADSGRRRCASRDRAAGRRWAR